MTRVDRRMDDDPSFLAMVLASAWQERNPMVSHGMEELTVKETGVCERVDGYAMGWERALSFSWALS